MAPIVITNVSPAKYQYLVNKLKANKEILINGNVVAFYGVDLRVTYANNTLTLTVISKPLMTTQATIQEIFEELMSDYVEPKPVTPPAPAKVD